MTRCRFRGSPIESIRPLQGKADYSPIDLRHEKLRNVWAVEVARIGRRNSSEAPAKDTLLTPANTDDSERDDEVLAIRVVHSSISFPSASRIPGPCSV